MPPDPSDIEESESSAPSDDGALDLEVVSEAEPPELEILQAPRNVDSVVSRIDPSSSPEAFIQIDLDSEAPEHPQEDHDASAADSSDVDDGQEEVIEELEDFEEIDDFEVVEDERRGAAEEAEDGAVAAASAPHPCRRRCPR